MPRLQSTRTPLGHETSTTSLAMMQSVTSSRVFTAVDIELPLLELVTDHTALGTVAADEDDDATVEGSLTTEDDEILDLEEADCGLDRLLRFKDKRVEARYGDALKSGRRQAGILVCSFWLAFCIVEYIMKGAFGWVTKDNVAASVTGVGRFVNIILLSAAIILLKLRVVSGETVGVILMFSTPLVALVNNGYRVAMLFDHDNFVRTPASCGATTCYDDSLLVLIFLVSGSLPLLLSLRITTTWMSLPWTAGLYAIFSVSGIGPLSFVHHMCVLAMYTSLAVLLFLGVYRIEYDLRHRWLDNLMLRVEMASDRAQASLQEERLREVEERLAALAGHSEVDLGTRANSRIGGNRSVRPIDSDIAGAGGVCTVPRPLAHSSAGGTSTSSTAGTTTTSTPESIPNARLVAAMAGRSTDLRRLSNMVEQIRSPSYGLRQFFEDCIATFPELTLFFALGDEEDSSSSGNSASVEYQRTIGALFAVYWLLRLEGDGKRGFCFGYDEQWHCRPRPEAPNKRRVKFYDDMDWACVDGVVRDGLCNSAERIQAMLCLTAFHDIMKVQALCPRVAAAHAPYHGYQAGEVVGDHDLALAYVLEHHPNLLPSFAALPPGSRAVILFTQSKMHFNHGWFVQAEAPPGPMLQQFKAVLSKATRSDLAFYFMHWLTDLSGAEGRPLAGAEKFTLRFPLSVLTSFLWSIPYLQKLAKQSESSVVETYLEARHRTVFPDIPLPRGDSAIALLRLVVMAQSGARYISQAFSRLTPQAQEVLAVELARTGIPDQSFARSPQHGGPALYVYYGPALLQHCSSAEEMEFALCTLSAVYSTARHFWPTSLERAGESVVIEGGALKANGSAIVSTGSSLDGKVMILEHKSAMEATVKLISIPELNRMMAEGSPFRAVELPNGSPWNMQAMRTGV